MTAPSTTEAPPTRRRRHGGRAHAARFALYLAACWSVPLALAAGLPGPAAWAVVGAALYTTVPLVAFVRWRGWPFYPPGAFRVLVVRAALYAHLLLPLVALAGALGMLAGAPFGAALAAGRVAAVGALAVAAAVLLAGYVGSRALVVREVDARVPASRRRSTGCGSRRTPTSTSARTRRAASSGASRAPSPGSSRISSRSPAT